MSNIWCIIMGGGRGTRLFPLTKQRCKPAVPLGGKYRLVDIAISNCLNSGYNQIFLLSQFNTASLHRHIQDAYKFDPFGGGFVDILSAEQTEISSNWYQGTADAVRQNLKHIPAKDDDLFIVLSGDQLYQMDLAKVVAHHQKNQAAVTIATTLVHKKKAKSFGIMRVNDDYWIEQFVEKPQDKETLEELTISEKIRNNLENPTTSSDYCLASMGIYVFNANTLRESLNSNLTDFGKEIIPQLIGSKPVSSFIFQGYWEDIGTIESFFHANLMLTDEKPKFNFHDPSNPVYTHARYLPGSKISQATISSSLITEGCIIHEGCIINKSILSLRSIVRQGSELDHVYMMGCDHFAFDDLIHKVKKERGTPPIGIGKNCKISHAIIDKNARIGNNVILSPKGKTDHFEQDAIYVRDGILIVTKNGIVPDGTIIA